MPEIQFGLLHGWQNLARDSVQTFAWVAKPCPRFGSDFCTVGYESPEIQGRLYPGGFDINVEKGDMCEKIPEPLGLRD